MVAVAQTVARDWQPSDAPPLLGDLVFFHDEQGTVFHSAVYIADNILFTKNGPTPTRPWVLMPLDQMLQFYPRTSAVSCRYFRRRDLASRGAGTFAPFAWHKCRRRAIMRVAGCASLAQNPFTVPGARLMFRPLAKVLALVLLTLPAAWLPAANEGQADLDKATELQLSAETLADLEKVIELAEGALKKGLDKGQTDFAKQVLAATLYQHANRLSAAIFEQTPASPKWPLVRQFALKDLDKAKNHDPSLPDVYLLEAKLQSLPGGDDNAAQTAIDEAIKLLKTKDDPKQLAKALILRTQMTDDNDKKLADFDAAAKADPENIEAWQGRALLYLAKGESEKAVADLEKLVARGGANPIAIGVLAEALTDLKKYDEALKYCNKVIEIAPNRRWATTCGPGSRS